MGDGTGTREEPHMLEWFAENQQTIISTVVGLSVIAGLVVYLQRHPAHGRLTSSSTEMGKVV